MAAPLYVAQFDDAIIRVEQAGAPKQTWHIHVERRVMMRASPYFLTAFSKNPDLCTIKEDDGEGAVDALVAWVRIVHGNVAYDLHERGVVDVWYLIGVADKYNFDIYSPAAKHWWEEWYDMHHRLGIPSLHSAKMLLFPAFKFDDAVKFNIITRLLVYESIGRIDDHVPRGFHMPSRREMRTRPSILNAINAVKGNIRSAFDQRLNEPNVRLLKYATCSDRQGVLYAYMQSLANTGGWPVFPPANDSLQTTFNKFRSFSKLQISSPPTCGSPFCTFTAARHVEKAIMFYETEFDGLCLGGSSYQPHPNWLSY